MGSMAREAIPSRAGGQKGRSANGTDRQTMVARVLEACMVKTESFLREMIRDPNGAASEGESIFLIAKSAPSERVDA